MRTETLGRCPICGSLDRRAIHAGLWDCSACHAAYRDPRPIAEDIAEAYVDYHTHHAPEDPFAEPRTRLGRFRRAARNGYVNRRYGYRATPASPFGAVILAGILPLRFAIEHWIHRLPAKPGRLLDVGCGNGGWLAQMRALGWQVCGVDCDPEVVRICAANGLDVRLGGIEAAGPGPFDAIALNHVIEHVHDPVVLLRACAARLSPSGWMWIATPNLDALGHRLYGEQWRGIEAPRHLVLFRATALAHALARAGLKAEGPLRTRAWAYEHFPAQHHLRKLGATLLGLLVPTLQEELVYLVGRT